MINKNYREDKKNDCFLIESAYNGFMLKNKK